MTLSTILHTLEGLHIYLEANGPELKVQGARENITPELVQLLKQHKQALLQHVSAATQKPAARIVPVDPLPGNLYPVSFAQERLWVLSQVPEVNVSYNIPALYRLQGALDQAVWTKSLYRLMDRHESLRTVFHQDEQGHVWQQIGVAETTEFNVISYDLRQDAAAEQTVMVQVQQAVMAPFDLAAGPLVRAGLYQLMNEQWVFVLVMHHLISDGWSMNVLMQELIGLYNAGIAGRELSLPVLPVQYKEYAVWQRQQLQGHALQAHQTWWRSQFEGVLPVLELPLDKQRPAVKTYNGLTHRHSFQPSITHRLKAFSQATGCTLFMSLLAGVNALLFRYTRQQDIIIGTPVAGREEAELEQQVGLYINTLAIRTKIGEMDSFRQLAGAIRQTTLNAFRHQAYPLDALAQELGVRKEGGRDVLFDVMLTVQPANAYATGGTGLAGLQVRPYEQLAYTISKYDVTFNFIEQENAGWLLQIEYNSDLFLPSTIERMSGHLERLLAEMLTGPDQPVCQIDYLLPAERQQLLETFNRGGNGHLPDDTLTSLFEKQVARVPDKPALVFTNKTLSYRELNECANSLAGYLQQTHNVQPGEAVAICLERSEWSIVSMLAVVKCGAVYMPVDPAYPPERIAFMLNDSGSTCCIDKALITTFLSGQHLYATSYRPVINQPAAGAYIMYTSGSTGNPKGVLVNHRGIVRLVAYSGYVPVTAEDVFLNLSNFSFDGSVFDIYGALLNGVPLVIAEQDQLLDPFYLSKLIQEHAITIFFTPTAFFNVLADSAAFEARGIKYIFFGGERASFAHVRIFKERYPHVILVNGYGPTENTVFSTFEVVDALHEGASDISIGKPIPHSRCYILHGTNVCPIGVVGEICVGGAGLAQGYLNQVTMTNERFVADPFRPGERMYRTGDLGRWLPNGAIEFMGRLDEQVKVRGYRVEPAEIERCLLSHAAVGSAIVIPWVHANGKGAGELVAYVAPSLMQQAQAPMPLSAIKNYLKERLPAYMLPAYWVMLPALPLTSNGKVDRRQLPAPVMQAKIKSDTYLAPRNETESRLITLWKEVLGMAQAGVQDDFFDLGGHSLKVTRLAGAIHREWGIRIALPALFKHTTIAEQAQLIVQQEKAGFNRIEPVAIQNNYPASSAQRRMWILSQLEGGQVAYNIPSVHVLEGHLSPLALEQALNDVVARHESLRTVLRADEQGAIRQYIRDVTQSRFSLVYEQGNAAGSDNWVTAFVQAPFNLGEGPLFRAGLYRLQEQQWVLVYVMHHIISDGWSVDLLIHELSGAYEARVRGAEAGWPPLRIQYKDYACWQQEHIKSEAMNRLRSYWLQQLAAPLPALVLPADRPRPAIKSHAGGTVQYRFPASVQQAFNELVRTRGATLFMGLVAAVKALLNQYTGQRDLLVGSPVAGREHPDLEAQVGLYVNTIVLRTRMQGGESFNELLQLVKEVTVHAYEHQAYPFDELVEALSLRRDQSRNAVFDVMVVLQHAEKSVVATAATPGGVRILPYEPWNKGWESGVSAFDCTFTFIEAEDALVLAIEYSSDLFNRPTIERMAEQLSQLIDHVIHHPGQPLHELAGQYVLVPGKTSRKQQLINDLDL